MPCPINHRTPNADTSNHLCAGHTRYLDNLLNDICNHHFEAHFYLKPTRTLGDGGGGRSREITLGVNVTALSWINGNEILLCLSAWERLIRAEQQLTPPGLLPPEPGVDAEIARLTRFHRDHLGHIAQAEWVADYFNELRDLHTLGRTAAQAHPEHAPRIHCPHDTGDGTTCRHLLTLNADAPLQTFTCPACQTEWTTLRLIAVAKADRTAGAVWVDIATASQLLGKSARQIRRVATEIHGPRRRSELVNFHALVDYYAA